MPHESNKTRDREPMKTEVPPEVDQDAEIKRLAKLAPLDYERERKAAAEKLGIDRLSVLDATVKAARAESGGATGQGRPLELPEIELWNQVVDGAALLDDIVAKIHAHVILKKEAAVAMPLWCVGTHTFELFDIFARLTVSSATPRCGKTTLRDVAAGLVAKPLLADSILAAALFRTVEAVRPTLLLDEAETYLGNNNDDSLRGIINSGHRREGCVIRCVGDDHQPRQFSTWAPMLLALIGKRAGHHL